MSNRMIVIGTGPIGGIIGGRLARAGQDITFVDVDKEHVAAIREKGLQVDVPDGPFNVKTKIVFPHEIDGKYDIAFIAVRLQLDRRRAVRRVKSIADVARLTLQFEIIQKQDAVVNYGCSCR